MANLAVVYYSSTGNLYALAQAVTDGAQGAGADVRLRRAEETAPDEAIDRNPEWREHLDLQRANVDVAALDDLEWADAYVFGTPSRYGAVSAQLKAFIDSVSPLWQAGKLRDKPASAFTSTNTRAGGQETTLFSLYTVFMHWGAIVVPAGYADDELFAMGNPYGVSHWDEGRTVKPSAATLEAARHQGARVATVAGKLNG